MRQCYLKEGSANTRKAMPCAQKQKARDEIAGFLLKWR